jgi:predicted metal-dependent phosphoesterase TrpH
LRIDFHTHTIASKDSLTRPDGLIRACRRKGLDRIVVTDHNTLAGALETRKLAPDLVIVGEEIKTTCGEILAAFVTHEVPGKLTPQEAIRQLRDQGAFISVSHPFDVRSGAWALEDLLEIAPQVDAVEVFNARIMKPDANLLAVEFARQHSLPGTAGSDAHAAFEVGAAYLVLPQFDGPEGLRTAIREGEVQGRQSPFWVHFASWYARWRKMKAKSSST